MAKHVRVASKVGQTASWIRLVRDGGQNVRKRDCPTQSGTVGQSGPGCARTTVYQGKEQVKKKSCSSEYPTVANALWTSFDGGVFWKSGTIALAKKSPPDRIREPDQIRCDTGLTSPPKLGGSGGMPPPPPSENLDFWTLYNHFWCVLSYILVSILIKNTNSYDS